MERILEYLTVVELKKCFENLLIYASGIYTGFVYVDVAVVVYWLTYMHWVPVLVNMLEGFSPAINLKVAKLMPCMLQGYLFLKAVTQLIIWGTAV